MYMGQNSDHECTIHREEYSYPKMTPLPDDKGRNIEYNIVEIRMGAVLILPCAGERRGTMLVQADMAQRERQLLQEMDQVRADLQLIGARCARGLDSGGDIVDQANHTVELTTNLALLRSHEQRLGKLERAWARLHKGQYGTCEFCGAQIDPARLDAMPHATLCVRCQQRSERRSHHER
jgi:DnaK suppressor protein